MLGVAWRPWRGGLGWSPVSVQLLLLGPAAESRSATGQMAVPPREDEQDPACNPRGCKIFHLLT